MPKTLAGVIGTNLKRLREDEKLSQAEVATHLRGLGLVTWTRNTVASVELGRRGLSIDELVMLSHLFGVEVSELFDGEDFDTGLADRGSRPLMGSDLNLDLARVRALLRGGAGLKRSNADLEKKLEARQALWDRYAWGYNVEDMAVERFHQSRANVRRTAEQLWGWPSVVPEYDRRISSRITDDTPRRSVDVIRGHVTRELLRELGEAFEKKKPTKKLPAKKRRV